MALTPLEKALKKTLKATDKVSTLHVRLVEMPTSSKKFPKLVGKVMDAASELHDAAIELDELANAPEPEKGAEG